MGIVCCCIAPHGAEIIPELAGEMLEAFAKTRQGMREMAELMKKDNPKTIVIATPHGLRLEETISVATSEFTEGTLEANDKQVKLRLECDRQLARNIYSDAKKKGLPIVAANYGTSEGPASCIPMDWGTLIPLWFLGGRNADSPRVVIITPSREIPLQNLVKLGNIIAEAAETTEQKTAFVASADQGHAHKADGPYGFHAAAKEYDEIVKRAISENDLRRLLELSPQFVEDAKPDSLWQIAILQGVLDRIPMNGRLVSYQAPTYFGLLCAYFRPASKSI